MRKYKVLGRASKEFCVSGGRDRKVKGSLSSRLRKQVQTFYERDDISRITSGIRDTITRQGEKRQKRILNDTIEKIHEKYLLENTEQKIRYASFSRLRPFWVQPPSETNKDTCACKQHEICSILLMHYLTSSFYIQNRYMMLQ